MKRIDIITGASSGLGAVFARQIASNGAADEIWLLARRKDKLESLAAELRALPAATQPKTVEIDLSGKAGVARFAELLTREAAAANGLTIGTLVNNAGFGTYGPFADTALDRELEMIDLNATTLTGLCHVALPYLGAGSAIINVASLASFTPLGNFAVYAATKAYVMSFSLALGAEIADRGIFVSTVCPGSVDTEFANVASNGAREKVLHGKSPEKVVAHCLRDVRRGKRLSVMAPIWKFKAIMSRFIGRYWFARWTYLHEKRPSR
jgi:short-subunit dehydrogenase